MKRKYLHIIILFSLWGAYCCAQQYPTQCFDYTDITASYVKCYYADAAWIPTTTEPWPNLGVKTGDPMNEWVHINIIEPNAAIPANSTTAFPSPYGVPIEALEQVPAGFTKSIRLGNYASGMGSAKIEYTITVDSTINPILIVHIAPILEEPGHDNGSGCKFYIKDQNGYMINPSCTMMQFQLEGTSMKGSMPGNPTWHREESFYYLDWPSFGIDLSPYHGQTITLVLHVYDCSEIGHLGMCYYTMECRSKEVTIERYGCDIKLIAPEGFFYRWFSTSDPSAVLSTAQTLTVPYTGDSLFYCDCSIDSAFNCKFSVFAIAKPYQPKAQFEMDIHSGQCVDTVWVKNTSYILKEGGVLENCDFAIWDFGGGRLLDGTVPNPNQYDWDEPILYTKSGKTTISLKVCVEDWGCMVDSTAKSFVASTVYTSFNDTICGGEFYKWGSKVYSATGSYKQTFISRGGCDSIVTLNLFVRERYNPLANADPSFWEDPYKNLENGTDPSFWDDPFMPTAVTKDTICDTIAYFWHDRPLLKSGFYVDTLKTTYGCDSITYLHLTVEECEIPPCTFKPVILPITFWK